MILGKGAALVNGNNIGSFWPSSPAHSEGCGPCDYRGVYYDGKCLSACGEPAQRWYHVPRSFLIAGEPNTLTLFEEAGGYPGQVNFQTVTAGTICARTPEGKTLNLSCQGGHTISKIEFASFENPDGTCGSFQARDCEASGIDSAVEQFGQSKTDFFFSCTYYMGVVYFIFLGFSLVLGKNRALSK